MGTGAHKSCAGADHPERGANVKGRTMYAGITQPSPSLGSLAIVADRSEANPSGNFEGRACRLEWCMSHWRLWQESRTSATLGRERGHHAVACLTANQGECHHPSSILRFNIFRALSELTRDSDIHVAKWLEGEHPWGSGVRWCQEATFP